MNLIDTATKERQELIRRTQDWKSTAESLAARVMRLQEANERAVALLEKGSTWRARLELLEATNE